MHRPVATLILTALVAFPVTSHATTPARQAQPHNVEVGLHLPTFQLEHPLLKPWPLLDRFRHPAVESLPASARFMVGPWGMARWNEEGWRPLHLDSLAASVLPWTESIEPAAEQWLTADPAREPAMSLVLWSPGGEPSAFADLSVFGAALVAPRPCDRSAVTFSRYGAESDKFPLLSCDGSIAHGAIDRLSVMLRPIGVKRPSLPLPDVADELAAETGEWLPSIRLVHPRLVWLIQQVASKFPSRPIHVISGYRPGAHEGQHHKGRAIDLSVTGVDKETVYRFCRTLRDVGCGYYPYHEFVHVDVRPPGTGNAYWIDDSLPGEPSNYVDSWPGVETSGAAAWNRWRRAGDDAAPGR